MTIKIKKNTKGGIRSITPYNLNGKIHGYEKEYYINGNISCKTLFIEGEINGIQEDYNENGDIQIITPFINDKLHGLQLIFDPRKESSSFSFYLFNKNRLILSSKGISLATKIKLI